MSATGGNLVRVRVSGVATTLTNEATTATGNISYQITDATKRVLDRSATITVKNGGVAVDPVADPYTLNRLSGKVVFATATSRTITISGQYLPMSTLAESHDVEFTCAATNADESVFGDADAVRQQMYKDASGSIARFFSTDTYLSDAFDASVPVVIEIQANSVPVLRAWALLNKEAFQGDRKSFLEESVTWEGTADADGRSHSFLL